MGFKLPLVQSEHAMKPISKLKLENFCLSPQTLDRDLELRLDNFHRQFFLSLLAFERQVII